MFGYLPFGYDTFGDDGAPSSSSTHVGKILAWSGSAWVEKPVKWWSGAAWVAKPLKRWNGSAWALA